MFLLTPPPPLLFSFAVRRDSLLDLSLPAPGKSSLRWTTHFHFVGKPYEYPSHQATLVRAGPPATPVESMVFSSTSSPIGALRSYCSARKYVVLLWPSAGRVKVTMERTETASYRGDPSSQTSQAAPGRSMRGFLLLFLASFLALYFELTIIRFISTEIRIFAYLKNVALVASFFGIGLGMFLESPPKSLKRLFPLIAAALLLLIKFSNFPQAHPSADSHFRLWNVCGPTQCARRFLARSRVSSRCSSSTSLSFRPSCTLSWPFSACLGGFVGEYLKPLPSLQGYGVNLAGSLVGILAFTVLSFLGSPPVVWVALGFLALASLLPPPAVDSRCVCLDRGRDGHSPSHTPFGRPTIGLP